METDRQLPILISNEKILEMIKYYKYSFSERFNMEKEEGKEINKRHRIKITSRICYGLAVVSLIVGASFHGYRIHPENVEHYNIGVAMGITMIIAFMIFLVAGILLTFLEKRK